MTAGASMPSPDCAVRGACSRCTWVALRVFIAGRPSANRKASRTAFAGHSRSLQPACISATARFTASSEPRPTLVPAALGNLYGRPSLGWSALAWLAAQASSLRARTHGNRAAMTTAVSPRFTRPSHLPVGRVARRLQAPGKYSFQRVAGDALLPRRVRGAINSAPNFLATATVAERWCLPSSARALLPVAPPPTTPVARTDHARTATPSSHWEAMLPPVTSPEHSCRSNRFSRA